MIVIDDKKVIKTEEDLCAHLDAEAERLRAIKSKSRKEYYHENREHFKLLSREYRLEHLPQTLERSKQYYVKNKEEILRKKKIERALMTPEEREKIREANKQYYREYYRKNKDRILAKARLKRANMTPEEKERSRQYHLKYQQKARKVKKIKKAVRKLKMLKVKQEIIIVDHNNKKKYPVLVCAYKNEPCWMTCSHFSQSERGRRVYCGAVEMGQLM